MTIYDIITFHKSLLQQFNKLNISSSDYLSADIYDKFLLSKEKGDKVTYITIKLAQEYNCSQRTIYNIIRKMEHKV